MLLERPGDCTVEPCLQEWVRDLAREGADKHISEEEREIEGKSEREREGELQIRVGMEEGKGGKEKKGGAEGWGRR